MAKQKAKWLRNHVALFHWKDHIVFAVRSLKGWKEAGKEEGREEGGKKKGCRSPPIYRHGFWTCALFYHRFQNSPCLFYLSLVHFCISILWCSKMKCWFHRKPTQKQLHYIIHTSMLAEITFQLFLCFDVNLLQETIAWKQSCCVAQLKITVLNSLNMLNLFDLFVEPTNKLQRREHNS